MTQEQWTAVDTYITQLFVGADDALDGTLATTDAAGLPPISVAPNEGALLHLLARSIGAHHVLEIGTLGGYSTIWLARALPAGGRVMTLEVSERHAAVARANLERAGVAGRVEIRLGAAIETLPQLANEGRPPFDLVFMDADKANLPSYFEWALRLARTGAYIIADNVVRDGRVLDAESRDADIQGVRKFNAMLAAEPRVTATVIQTVSGKGYDGMAIALVTG
ncbi:MAG: O-methyltransferase [Dehalococcoidia bacterium]|nr:O-methyltransferase [Dehalococcoidia bacterium]